MSTVAASSACALLGVLCVFQVALAFGAPWGRYAWGGQHDGSLPRRLRAASAASVPVYAALGLVLLWRAGHLGGSEPGGVARVAAWVVAGYLALGTVLNGVSRSPRERRVMTPVAAVLAVLAVVVAAGP